jgi:hypothetical protein
LTEFVSGAFKKLETKLLGEILINNSFVFGESDSSSVFTPSQIRNLLSGSMSLEWQLLMWLRSGKDFKAFETFLQSNIKAVLLNFLGRPKDKGINNRIKKMTGELDTISRSVIKGIESRQISNILNDAVEKKGFYMELPLSPVSGDGDVKVRSQKRNGALKKNETKNYVFSFDAETSNAGTINVVMSVSGKNMTLSFGFENKKLSGIAKDFSDEIRNSLIKRGFMPGIIEFHGPEQDNKNKSEKNSQKTRNLDIKA